MRKLLVATVLATVFLLSNAGDASACRWSCGWGCGWGCGPCYSYCCSPCWGYSYCSPCYSFCGPSYYYAPCYYPYYSYSYCAPYSYYAPPVVIVGSGDNVGAAPIYASARSAPAPTLVANGRRPSADLATLVMPEAKTSPQASVSSNRAKVIVNMPADAKLMVEGKTVKTGEGQREFITPQLEPGSNYRYTIKAEVVRNNQVVSQSREVRVRAGETTRVSFDLPAEGVATASR